MDLQAVIAFEVNPAIDPPQFNICDCDTTPYPSFCCSHLDQTIPLTYGGVGGYNIVYVIGPDEYDAYLEDYYRIEEFAPGDCILPSGQPCQWGASLQMCCTDSSDDLHCFGGGGLWWVIQLHFVKLFSDDDTWTLGILVVLDSYYSGNQWYDLIDLGSHKIDCTDLSFEFELQPVPGFSVYGYCLPTTLTIERV
jgi:hypothetical protein